MHGCGDASHGDGGHRPADGGSAGLCASWGVSGGVVWMHSAALGVRPRERSEHVSSVSPKRFRGKPWTREKEDREGWRPAMCSTTLRSGASAGKRSRMDSPDGSRICGKKNTNFRCNESSFLIVQGVTMRRQLLSTLVWIFPPSFCSSPLGGDVSASPPVRSFSCWLFRSSAIRFSTNSRS